MRVFVGVVLVWLSTSISAVAVGSSQPYGQGGWFEQFDPVKASATSHLMSAYNGRLRAYLATNHVMDTHAFHTISGSDMIGKFGYRECR